MSAYYEKLKNPRWQKKRLEIFERDYWTCQGCLSKDQTLHVHHLSYLPGREPWDYDNEYLITLCEDCHAEITEEIPKYEKQINSQLRLILKYPLFYQFTLSVLQQYDNNLLFLLFDCKERKEEIIDFLRKIDYEICQKYRQQVNPF